MASSSSMISSISLFGMNIESLVFEDFNVQGEPYSFL